MPSTITIEIPADAEALVRQFLALHDELNALALTAPHGTVLDTCEQAVIDKGRDLHNNILTHAVNQRLQEVEKKGRRSASATAADSRKTAARPSVSSSPRSAS